MKKMVLFSIASIILTSCYEVKQIGNSINMVSHRNIDFSTKYDLISNYSGTSKKEIKKSKAESIDEAIDQTVKKVPGGEFLMNVKIYMINGKYYACEGDVWGKKAEISYRGFKVGDKVSWKVLNNFKRGEITSLKDDKRCLIKTESGDIIEKTYDEITKVE